MLKGSQPTNSWWMIHVANLWLIVKDGWVHQFLAQLAVSELG